MKMTKERTHRWIRLQYSYDCWVNKSKKAGAMLQTNGQWQDHKHNVHIEDHKKETSKEVKDFSKEVPASILKRMRYIQNMLEW
jgi:hypothetical protein